MTPPPAPAPPALPDRASTGVPGLDALLDGGLPRDEMHLVQGGGGTGKTTLALHFLRAGVAAGEAGLYVTLSQTPQGLAAIARSHGWALDGIAVHELSPGTVADRIADLQTVLDPADVELGEVTRELRELVEALQPRRVVFDSIGVIGLLAGSPTRYHREIILLRQFLAGRGCTALFLGDWPAEPGREGEGNTEFHSVTASVIHLDQFAPDYGSVRRRLRIMKMRAVSFASGYHNFAICRGGLVVYPRLDPAGAVYDAFELLPSGVGQLDELLGGGLEYGTACLLVGPPGSGKSTVAGVFVRAAAARGQAVSVFLFDERPETFVARSAGVGIPLRAHRDDGTVDIDLIDTSAITPGAFADRVRDAVERRGAKVLLIDSLNGYFSAMDNTRMIAVHMHEVLNYASRRGVLTLLTVSQAGFMSVGPTGAVDVSYLSDTIVTVRSFEADGVVRRGIAAVKKRQGPHSADIRELFITPGRVSVGDAPLSGLGPVLGGARVGG